MEGTRIRQKKKEEELFQLSVQPFFGEMRRFCVSLAGSVWDGDDLFQISMIKLYKAWARRPSRPITKAYLYRIISNTWIDGHRKVSLDETVTDFIEHFADGEEKEKIAERLSEGMKVLINRLSAKQRLIFLLIAGMGYNASEAAELTGESEGNVRVVYHRARKKLVSSGGTFPANDNDELADRYVAAFQSHTPESLMHIYQLETGAAFGSMPTLMTQTFIPRRAVSDKVLLLLLARVGTEFEQTALKISCAVMAA
ncbi:RNA polymerase sigma factor [Sporolactobacillus putidus]|uniref:RNA polymerase sigma-70 factor, ECF subfamily n=1 Tax=Sporolactobacillus putidus TaxID=492735 RepID=A0A917S4M4_9BACL|nr:RNA polymerase sigma factor [Sporolactobacillus putidus]GGL58123.1 hypothetical protein GCM10007968_22690 [Sporolactobacillus putidus]